LRTPLIARSVAGFLLVLAFRAHALELRLDRTLAPPPPPPRTETPAPPQALIAEVRVNDERKGEHVLFLRGRDDFLVARSDLAVWVAVPAQVHGPVLDGQEYVALSAIPRAQWRFDEERLELRITFPPDAFETQRYAYVGEYRLPKRGKAARPERKHNKFDSHSERYILQHYTFCFTRYAYRGSKP
jgi:outer membrane usher protein FimD/PapC